MVDKASRKMFGGLRIIYNRREIEIFSIMIETNRKLILKRKQKQKNRDLHNTRNIPALCSLSDSDVSGCFDSHSESRSNGASRSRSKQNPAESDAARKPNNKTNQTLSRDPLNQYNVYSTDPHDDMQGTYWRS